MKKILLAYDGGEPAKRALDQTIELAKHFDATVGVISVVPVRASVGRPSTRGTTGPSTPRSSSRPAGCCARPASRPSCWSRAATRPKTIEHMADERGYDTIVIGTRGLGTLARTLQGSVSEHVAANAHVTVVVAR